MAPLPERIVRRAGPTDDGTVNDKREDGNDDHAPRLTLNVRDGIERDLPANEGSFVTAKLCRERMGRFMAGSGEEKSNVSDEAGSNQVGVNSRHELSHGSF